MSSPLEQVVFPPQSTFKKRDRLGQCGSNNHTTTKSAAVSASPLATSAKCMRTAGSQAVRVIIQIAVRLIVQNPVVGVLGGRTGS